MKSLFSITFLLILAFPLYTQKIINLFVDYNIITFSSFTNLLLFNSQKNINQYIEYNEIIPVYIFWKDKKCFEITKNLLKKNELKLFSFSNESNYNDKKEEWFYSQQEKIRSLIFTKLLSEKPQITYLKKPKDIINIFNFTELDKTFKTLETLSDFKEKSFKIDLNLFLSERIADYFNLITKFSNFNYNFYIIPDKNYLPDEKDITLFIDNIFPLKINSKLEQSEQKLLNLSFLLFKLKLYNNIFEIFLNLFPLETKSIKKYINSAIYTDEAGKQYLTLFDSENFITFDLQTGYLKNWINYKKGDSVINFDSFIENIYIQNKKDNTRTILLKKDLSYLKFKNGAQFKIDYENGITIEKNIIFIEKYIYLTYRIRNASNSKKYLDFYFENKYSPSLYDLFTNFSSDILFYDGIKKIFTNKLNNDVTGIINCNSNTGVYFKSHIRPDCVEVVKGFYYYTLRHKYSFSLYPYENKNITFEFGKFSIKDIKLENKEEIEEGILGSCE